METFSLSAIENDVAASVLGEIEKTVRSPAIEDCYTGLENS